MITKILIVEDDIPHASGAGPRFAAIEFATDHWIGLESKYREGLKKRRPDVIGVITRISWDTLPIGKRMLLSFQIDGERLRVSDPEAGRSTKFCWLRNVLNATKNSPNVVQTFARPESAEAFEKFLNQPRTAKDWIGEPFAFGPSDDELIARYEFAIWAGK